MDNSSRLILGFYLEPVLRNPLKIPSEGHIDVLHCALLGQTLDPP